MCHYYVPEKEMFKIVTSITLQKKESQTQTAPKGSLGGTTNADAAFKMPTRDPRKDVSELSLALLTRIIDFKNIIIRNIFITVGLAVGHWSRSQISEC